MTSLAVGGRKSCKECGQNKPVSDYYAARPGYFQARCKPCHTTWTSARATNRRQETPEVVRARDKRYESHPTRKAYVQGRRDSIKQRYLMKTYGLSLDGYNSMHEAQGGCCAICDNKTVLFVDHDHSTGAVRKLLCSNCNFAIGHLGDDVERVMSAAAYLIEHQPILTHK